MSTQMQTINLNGNEPLKPTELIGVPPISQNIKNLISDEDIDKLIDSQKSQVENKPTYINLQKEPLPIPEHKENSENDTEESNINLDLNKMNFNLDQIGIQTKLRIEELDKKQKKISARIELVEKFITLDEKNLAIESTRQEPNMQKIIGLKKSIFSQTELISETTDILLKFEAQIQGWYKTLMDIEKDKVSAYQKFKTINKEQASTDTDINDVMASLNGILKSNPQKLLSMASNTLNIGGYSGKKFNEN